MSEIRHKKVNKLLATEVEIRVMRLANLISVH